MTNSTTRSNHKGDPFASAIAQLQIIHHEQLHSLDNQLLHIQDKCTREKDRLSNDLEHYKELFAKACDLLERYHQEYTVIRSLVKKRKKGRSKGG